MAIIASEPSTAQLRADRRLSRATPRTLSAGSARSPHEQVPILSANRDNLRVATGVLEGVGDGVDTVDAATSVVEHVLPLSGCSLRVIDLDDGSRIGQLFAPSGLWLDEARCERTGQVSGWFGRLDSGATWALAFGAGGAHESLEVRFASLRARRVVPVVSDHYGLWVAEVVGSFRAATILAPTQASTFRLHYVA